MLDGHTSWSSWFGELVSGLCLSLGFFAMGFIVIILVTQFFGIVIEGDDTEDYEDPPKATTEEDKTEGGLRERKAVTAGKSE
jgi:hypothetical protein